MSAMKMRPLVLSVCVFIVGCSATETVAPQSSSSSPAASTLLEVVPTTAQVTGSAAVSTGSPPDSTGESTLEEPAGPLPTYVAVGGEQTPQDLPAFVDGYAPNGEVVTGTDRVFVDNGVAVIGPGASAGGCDRVFWAIRWRASGETPLVVGRGNASFSYETPLSDLYDLAAVGSRGYMTGFGCEQPVFGAISASGGSSLLDEVIFEYQTYAPTVDGTSQEIPPAADAEPVEIVYVDTPPLECTSYSSTFDLPLSVCEEGLTVGHVQRVLGELGYEVTYDNQFGVATLRAVREFQSLNGLVPDGHVGVRTWSLLMVNGGLPGNDLNGDGVILPSELGE
jgi:hypothetical protein